MASRQHWSLPPLMSVFGTTMTAFALVGSTGKSFERGIGTYGLMASISGLVHAAIFFLVGIRLWAFGKKHGYITQIQFFRARFESDGLGYLLFPILVLLVVPYLLIGIIGAGKTIEPVTAGAFPEIFINPSSPAWLGGIPPWLTGLVVSIVVLSYVFMGGSRGPPTPIRSRPSSSRSWAWWLSFSLSRGLAAWSRRARHPPRITETGAIVQDFRHDKEAGELKANDPPKTIGKVVRAESSDLADRQPHLNRVPVTAEFKKKIPKTGELVSFERELGIPFGPSLPTFSYP